MWLRNDRANHFAPRQMKRSKPYSPWLRKLDYHEFRTGLTFGSVRRMMWVDNHDSTTWKYKRRRCVLRFWREIKQQMYAEYEAQWERNG